MPKVRYFVVGIFLLFTGGSAKGETIISTFGSGDSYSACCAEGNVAPAEIAYPFVIPSGPDFIFTDAALALSEGIGSTNAVDISLAMDLSDAPGAVLETFHLANALGPAGANNPLVVIDSVLNPLLLAGSQYWLIEMPSVTGNGVNWQTAFISPNPSQRASRDDTGPWTVDTIDSFQDPGAFSISGTASVPEPASNLLLGAALLALWAVRLRGSPENRIPAFVSLSTASRRPEALIV